jgi:RNA polymerase sigma factor (sigma-70 family)
MAYASLHTTLQSLLRRTGRGPAGDVADGDLLDRFSAGGDQAAFVELLGRHGPMVLGVCQRILGDTPDAEDAFQAAFLVLARKADSLDRQRPLGNWLYTVAHNLALDLKADICRRRTHERQGATVAAQEPTDDPAWREVKVVLDAELSRLPEKYRAPVVLCYLEGKTNESAARELGWPSGSMAKRLARARELLRHRLAGRGVALSTGLFATLLADRASAVVPPALAEGTGKAAAAFAGGPLTTGVISARTLALAERALQATSNSWLRTGALIVVLAGLMGVGTGILLGHPAADPSVPLISVEPAAAPAVHPNVLGPVSYARRHEDAVTAVAFAGVRMLASGSGDGTIRLWDISSGNELRRMARHESDVSCVAITPDGSVLASGGGDHRVGLWDTGTGKLLRWLDGADRYVTSLAFSPNGKTLAVGAHDAEIRLWDATNGTALPTVQGSKGYVLALAYSPDGTFLAAGDRAANVTLWNVVTGKPIHVLKGHKGWVLSLAFAPDSRTLASGSCDGTARIWSVAAGNESRKLEGHKGSVLSAAFTPDGRTLISAGWDRTVRLWNVATAKERCPPLLHESAVTAIAVAGKVFASGHVDGRLLLRPWTLVPGDSK